MTPPAAPTDTRSDARGPSLVRRVVRRIVIAAFVVEVVLPLALFGCRSSLMFFPAETPTPDVALSDANGLGVTTELLEVTRPDGRRLVGYDARPEGAAPDGPVVLVFHGNAGNVAGRAGWLRWYTGALGHRVVLASYSGYGGNAGSPSAAEVEIDALAWFDHLVAAGVAPSRVVLHGRSIGGGPAFAVAAQRGAAGVIAQSTFSSLRSMARRRFGWLPLAAWLAGSDFPSAERAAAMAEPLLIVHGTADPVVPFAEGEALAAAVPTARFVPIPGANHDNVDGLGGEPLLQELRAAIAEWTR